MSLQLIQQTIQLNLFMLCAFLLDITELFLLPFMPSMSFEVNIVIQWITIDVSRIGEFDNFTCVQVL